MEGKGPGVGQPPQNVRRRDFPKKRAWRPGNAIPAAVPWRANLIEFGLILRHGDTESLHIRTRSRYPHKANLAAYWLELNSLQVLRTTSHVPGG